MRVQWETLRDIVKGDEKCFQRQGWDCRGQQSGVLRLISKGHVLGNVDLNHLLYLRDV